MRVAEEYDYVIAGGGTAGCVLAARLSEDPSVSVLLIEAGRADRNPLIHAPAGFAKLTSGPFDWGLSTEPQKHAEGRRIPYAQGKVLGGGGSINAQVFTRGTPADYDGWAQRHGAEGWSFADVLPSFRKAERNARLSGPLHGSEGPAGVSDQVNPHPLSLAFVRAGQEMGLPYNSDFNGERQVGVGIYQSTTWNARRASAAVAYLAPARGRRNLTVLPRACAVRLRFTGRRAIGVDVVQRDAVRPVTARREVIVSAGAIGSPKLLQLSGVGDPEHLKSIGIDVVVPSPGVGRNLQDHCDLDIIYTLKRKSGLDRLARVGPASAWAVARYLMTRTGPLASTVVEAGAFTHGDPDDPEPNLQFHFLPAAGVEAGVRGVKPGFGVTINSYFLRPESRGTVLAASSDPRVAPRIDPNYLATERDVAMSVEGVRQSRELMSQSSMAREIAAEHIGDDIPLRTSDDYIRFVRAFGRTSYHPVGTCAMGSGGDAVLDPQLRVRGAFGLRVVDASVMPAIVSSNTQFPTIMIAERAAELIRSGTEAGI